MKITTIKLQAETKARINKLREYKRESYDEILKKMLGILNVAKVNSEQAKSILMHIDENRSRLNIKKEKPKNGKEI